MSVAIENLNELATEDVRQEVALIAELLQEKAPTIDVRRGVLHDLLLLYSATFAAKNQVEQDRLRKSSSINAILADPTLADDTIVDNIASNYRVTRQGGTVAGGAVTVVLDRLRDLTIAVGSEFDSQGKKFVTEQVFTGRANESSVVAGTDRLMIDRGDGTYSFQITVAASEPGEASQLLKGTALVPRVLPLGFVIAQAAEDFIGGLDSEDNKTLVERLAFGLTSKSMADRFSMSATLRDKFSSVVHDSIIGFGDAEMLRDRHTIWPSSLGGKGDWYIQTQSLYRTNGATKSATLVEKTGDGYGIWQMTFDRDEYPGFYSLSIEPLDNDDTVGEFEITGMTRGYDVTELESNDGFVPEIKTAEEAAFSRFQTVIVKFKDSIKSTSGLTVASSTDEYTISVLAMPLIAEIQDYVLERSVRNVTGDVLVRAPVPALLSFSCKIELIPGQAEPDTTLITDDLVRLVNNYGFLGRLPISALLDVVHNHITDDAAVVSPRMLAKLLFPDGSFRWLQDAELLEIQYEPALMTTSRTTMFFLDPANVSIDVVTADIAAVI
jgi:hypothetical protein